MADQLLRDSAHCECAYCVCVACVCCVCVLCVHVCMCGNVCIVCVCVCVCACLVITKISVHMERRGYLLSVLY